MPNLNVGLFASVLCLFISILCVSPSFAASICNQQVACMAGAYQKPVMDFDTTNACISETSHMWGNECVRYCLRCADGYTAVSTDYTNSSCSNSLPIKKCVVSLDPPSSTFCATNTYSSSKCGTTPAYDLGDCAASSKNCFGGSYVQTCTACKSGTLTTATYTPDGCTNSYTYQYCKSSAVINPDKPIFPGIGNTEICAKNSQCTSQVGTTETDCGTASTHGECVSGYCKYITSYFCNEGCYIKESIIIGDARGECAPCPTHPDGGSVSSPGVSGNYPNTINQCYLAAGQTHTDSSGSYTFTDDCNYEGNGWGHDAVIPAQ